jgi:putative redox protein
MSAHFKEVVENTRAAFAALPEQALVTFQTVSNQEEGLRSTVSARQFSLTVDEPETLGGKDAGPNPVELVLAALGTCQEVTYRLYADSLGIPLDGISVKVEGHIDLRGFFALDDAVRPGYRDIHATVEIDSPADEADIRRLTETVDGLCPVLDILTNKTPVTLSVEHVSRKAAAA